MPLDVPYIEPLDKKLSAYRDSFIAPNEAVLVQLPGNVSDALICTDRRVLVLKIRALQKQSVFQINYKDVSGAQVVLGALLGFFEITAYGMQTTPKNNGVDVGRASNCVALANNRLAPLFREACGFVLSRANGLRSQPEHVESANTLSERDQIFSDLTKLSELYTSGILTEAEFQSKKTELLLRI